MSRTTLAALRKHATAAEFAKRYLLPVVKRGNVPPIKNWPNGVLPPTKSSKQYEPIIFTNATHPEKVFFLSMQYRAEMDDRSGGQGKPHIRLAHRTRGARIDEKDWNAAQDAIGIEPRERKELALRHEHVNPAWKVEEQIFQGKKRKVYVLPEKVFNEIANHVHADKNIYQFETIILYLSRVISEKTFVVRTGMRYSGDPIENYITVTEMKGKFLKRLMSAPTAEKAAGVLVGRFHISKRLALALGKRVIDLKYEEKLKPGWQALLAKLRQQ